MKRPRILITTASSTRDHGLRRTDSVTGQNYSEAVVLAGGLPLMVANLDPALAEAFCDEADGVIFSGGADVDPELFGQEPHPELGHVCLERDRFELALYRAAKARGLPILGICRGIQLINVAEGGTLHQHLPALAGTIQHSQRAITGEPAHWVALEPSSHLATALGETKLKTNSYHHQAIATVGRSLRVTGKTTDGVIEAVEGTSEPFVLGVQWHPEMSFQHFPEHLVPFQLLVDAARARTHPHAVSA